MLGINASLHPDTSVVIIAFPQAEASMRIFGRPSPALNDGSTTIDAVLQGPIAAVTGLAALYNTLPGHAVSTGTTLSDTAIRTAYQRMVSQYPGFGDMSGLLYIRRAPDTLAKDSGQYGLNLTGYADNIGSGVEWGLYFNNSHSTAPRVRMLAIENGYATTLLAGMGAVHTAVNFGNETATQYEQVLGGVAYSGLLCGAVLGPRSDAYKAYGAFQGTAGTESYVHDPEACFATFDSLLGGALHAGARLQALGALSTLGFGIGSRYQVYYPEDEHYALEVIEECAAFPHGEYDDYVDSTTQAMLRYRQGYFVSTYSDEDEMLKMRSKKYIYY